MISVKIHESRDVDKLLANMPIELREKTLVKAIRKAANEVAKEARRRVTPPGYQGDQPGETPLKRSIRTVVRRYPNAVAGFVGPTWPDGAHGHLVEYGHVKVLWGKRTDGFVEGKPFMRPAADLTEPQQKAAIISTLKKQIGELVD